MLFGCVVWGHLLGVRLTLRNGLQGSCGKLGVLYHSALCWFIAASMHIRGAALHLLCHAIPLHSLITKCKVRCFARLEDELQHFKLLGEAATLAGIRQPFWAASFVRAATKEMEMHHTPVQQEKCRKLTQ